MSLRGLGWAGRYKACPYRRLRWMRRGRYGRHESRHEAERQWLWDGLWALRRGAQKGRKGDAFAQEVMHFWQLGS